MKITRRDFLESLGATALPPIVDHRIGAATGVACRFEGSPRFSWVDPWPRRLLLTATSEAPPKFRPLMPVFDFEPTRPLEPVSPEIGILRPWDLLQATLQFRGFRLESDRRSGRLYVKGEESYAPISGL